MSVPAVERTMDELKSQHDSEAQAMGKGWQTSYTGGSLPGDITVSILPPTIEAGDLIQDARYYLYRRNPISGKFTLIKKT